jgi:hypothetical protein
MHSFRTSLSETCIRLLCNYYCFCHKRDQKGGERGSKKFELFKFSSNFNAFFLQSVHFNKLLMGHNIFLLFYFKKGFEISHIWKEYRILIFHLILRWEIQAQVCDISSGERYRLRWTSSLFLPWHMRHFVFDWNFLCNIDILFMFELHKKDNCKKKKRFNGILYVNC